jgi:6-phosphogluconate dehydrogenase (decarboxylating)
MELALYELGRMGGNMVLRLVRGGQRVVAGNRSSCLVDEAARGGAVPAYTIEEMVSKLQDTPKIVWLMVPYGQVTGEGSWTAQAAIDESVPAPVITLLLLQRFVSRQKESFSAKVIAALRNQFGGHAVRFEGGEMGGVKHQA